MALGEEADDIPADRAVDHHKCLALGAVESGHGLFGVHVGEQDVVDVKTLNEMAAISDGKAFRVKTTDDLMAVADAIDELEGGRAKAPPVPLRRDLWPWPAALALLCACGLLAVRRDA